MQKIPLIKYRKIPLGEIPYGKFFSLTRPAEKFTFKDKNVDLWFRGNPNNIIPVSAPHYAQCVHINGSTIQQIYDSSSVFLLSNILCNHQCSLPVEKKLSDLTEDECVIQEETCWIIIRDAATCDHYSGVIIFNPPTGRFLYAARDHIVQSTLISRASTQQY